MTDRLAELHNLLKNHSGSFPFTFVQDDNAERKHLSFFDLLHQVVTKSTFQNSDKSLRQESPFNRRGLEKEAKEFLPEAIEQLLQQLKLASKQTSPIIAIAGVLNAGKSSLVASFLSSAGRDRLLIGSSNKQGTHRFVLWLPESWKQIPQLWENTLSQIENVFGFPAEELSGDKDIAFTQYNGHYSKKFQDKHPTVQNTPAILVPLVATDIALDLHGIGLMDCPDIQTGFFADIEDSDNAKVLSNASYSLRTDSLQAIFADQRRVALTNSLRISSAFIVVTPANSIQEKSVSEILAVAGRVMPGLKMMLAVNRVPRKYFAFEIAHELRNGYSESNLWRIYMAYHFDGPLLRERLPVPPTSTTSGTEDWNSLPLFFRIDKLDALEINDAKNKTSDLQATNKASESRSESSVANVTIPNEDFLISIGNQLDPSRLTQERLQTMKADLVSKVNEGLHLLSDHNQLCLSRRQRWYTILAQVLFRMSIQSGSKSSDLGILRLQISQELVQQIMKSLEKTAPWWALPGRVAARWSSWVQQLASNATNWLPIPGWVSEKASSISSFVTSKWRTGEGGRIISPHDLFESIVAHDLSHRLISDQSPENRKRWEERFQQSLTRFQTESKIRLSDEQLDEYTAEMWRRMDWSQRLWQGVAPAGMIFAPVLAVLMLPIDFGGTTVLLAATGKELLFAGMTAVGFSMLNADSMPKLAEAETAWNQLSELFAILCDEIGIARPTSNQMPLISMKTGERALNPAKIAAHTKQALDSVDAYYPIEPSTMKTLRSLMSEI